MKTTLEIPDDIYRELKVKAAREGVTLTKLIVAALRRPVEAEGRPSPRALSDSTERKVAEWIKRESEFLDAMRGPVFEQNAVSDLIGGRR